VTFFIPSTRVAILGMVATLWTISVTLLQGDIAMPETDDLDRRIKERLALSEESRRQPR